MGGVCVGKSWAALLVSQLHWSQTPAHVARRCHCALLVAAALGVANCELSTRSFCLTRPAVTLALPEVELQPLLRKAKDGGGEGAEPEQERPPVLPGMEGLEVGGGPGGSGSGPAAQLVSQWGSGLGPTFGAAAYARHDATFSCLPCYLHQLSHTS